jgi:hypothetical protein
VLRTLLCSLAFFLLIGICGSAVRAQTINAASCNASDVQHALSSASSATTTVVIPAGTCTWTSGVSYSVPASVTNLTIQGQTQVNCTGTAGTSSYACTAIDNTVLVDSLSSSNQPLLNINVGNAAFRLTGVTFKGGTLGSGVTKPNGFLNFGGTSTSFRIDHCDFNTNTYSASNSGGGFTIFSSLYGVVDHNTFELSGENNGVRYYQGAGDFGDTLWSQPTNFGSSSFLFVENNVFTWGASNDCDEGGRMVMRYNTIIANPNETDTGLWQGHQMGQGTPTDRTRGCRALEIYHNYIYNPNPSDNQYAPGDGGSGTGLVWGNTISSGYSFDVIFQTDREASNHTQAAPPNGFGYCGSNSSGVTSPWDGDSAASTGYPCIDQTGRGQGDLLNGQGFPNARDTATGSISWPHNLLEPWYVWDETIASGQVFNAPSWNGVSMAVNRDFYVQTSPFTGASGVGSGLLSARPTTCTAGPGGTYGQSPTGSYGVAYWATDANSGNGELYICTSANTWTPVYSPYTYPHPLVNGGAMQSNAPNPPTGLIATVQ